MAGEMDFSIVGVESIKSEAVYTSFATHTWCSFLVGPDLDTNPACYCGRPSRRRVSGKAPYDSSYLEVQCATAACDYSESELDQYGEMRVVRRAEIPE